MAHEIEIHPETQQAAFVAARESAWHGLGQFKGDGLLTVPDALRDGFMANWAVHTEPLFFDLATGLAPEGTKPEDLPFVAQEVPGHFAVVRTNPFDGVTRDVLGVVGHQYKVIQNEEMAAFAEAVLDVSGAYVSAAGSLKGGRRAFMTLTMPEGFTVGGQDAHDLWFTVATGHDGSLALTGFIGALRVVCQNTLTWGMRTALTKVSIHHSGNLADKMAQAKQALGVVNTWREAVSAGLEGMLATQMTTDEFQAIVEANFAPIPAGASRTITERRTEDRNQLVELFTKSETNEFGRGTRLGAYNSITEWAEFFAPKDPTTEAARTASVMGETANIRQKAWDLLAV